MSRWDDPPEDFEPPECCGEFMDVDGRALVCATCGNRQEMPPDPREARDMAMEAKWEEEQERRLFEDDEATDYDYEADDLAFDAARERGLR